MRKFFSIVLYVIAGMFSFILVIISFMGMSKESLSVSEITITLFIILAITMFFFLLASLLYPSKNYYKPMYITLLSSTMIAFFGSINLYFIIQGYKNSDINTSMTAIFKNDTFLYNFTIGISVSILFLLMTLYFYVLSKKIDVTVLKRKKWLPFFISFAIMFFIIYAPGKFLEYEKFKNLPKDKVAQYKLAETFNDGGSARLDYKMAVKLYTLSAEQGYDKAQNTLAGMYYYGDGVEKDYKKAVEFYQKASNQGNKRAQFNLAEMYVDEEGVSKDYKKAIELYEKSIKQGYIPAEYALANLYYYGDGVKKDIKKAIKLYEKAASKNNNDSLYRLARIYSEGKIVEQDYNKSIELYKKISEPNDYGVWEELASFYDKGKGVIQNHDIADELYLKACAANYKEAIESLNSSNKKILKLGEPSVRLALTTRKTSSFFGGKPLVSDDFVWPKNDDVPLSFIGELDLSALNIPWLPKTGRLLFFYDMINQPWGIYPEDQKSSIVIYDKNIENLHIAQYPTDLKKDSIISSIKYLRADKFISYPSANMTNRIKFFSKKNYSNYYDFIDEYYMDPRHQVDGYPSTVQSDTMEESCQDIDLANTSRKSKKNDWKMLLQFDTDDDLGVMWADVGRLYFWIRESDARNNVFSNTCVVLQSN